jgi:predicted nuclease with TOPRIM domain
MQEYESMLMAREQDSEVKEENEELRKAVKALKQENKTLTSAAKKLQMQTKKYETAFDTLQEKLETMNVSNAKLLYINQALENASLNERQKRKIVEAISKADTVQEAKIVFDTMNEAVSTSLDVRKSETLNEVVSRRSSLLVAARNEQPKKDANPMYNRLQKLAGIKTQKS